MKRRTILKYALLTAIPFKAFAETIINMGGTIGSNFKYIYSSEKLKKEFLKFLQNVFNLFPENDFHTLIDKTTKQKASDQEIYTSVQNKLSEITPILADFRFSLPALTKQKQEMARQSLELIGKNKKINGYLEIGSSGRYLDYLEEYLNISDDRYYTDWNEPGYSPTEMIDRGQITIGAKYIPMANYKTNYAKVIPNNSIDLVTVFIGFHHCPLDLRIPFISSIRNTMRTGGKLILRDHDCTDETQKTIVALAHDVFNMGTKQTWDYNKSEIRNFYSLDFIIKFVENLGFRFEKRTLFQAGDPTKNALVMFTKI